MFHISKWKIIVAILVCFFSLYVVVNSFLGKSGNKVNLGLDLRGGAYLLLEVDYNSYFKDKIKVLKEEIRNKLRNSQIGYMNLLSDEKEVSFSLRSDDIDINKILSDIARDIKIDKAEKKITISYSDLFIKEQKKRLLEQSLEIIRRRVDETGTKEPLIQPRGYDRIILQVPGLENPERLKNILGKTAKLSFHLLHPETPITDNLFYVPDGYQIISSKDGDNNGLYLVENMAAVEGSMLNDAQATINQGQAQVSFKFNNQGARKFGDLTSNNTGRMLAVILDGKVISAPVIREPILGGNGVISGNFTISSANDLALLLRAGSLPVPLNIIEERTVGPSLGEDSILAGKKAVIVGFIIVLLLIVVIYNKFGAFSSIALCMNIIFIFASLSLIGATLTLPGIAGIVLTIGMAVDTNVLIFERIREESRSNKSIYAIIDQGFTQALKTITDSNLTTLIAALILFNFGSGPVKGFAVTLAVGILSSIFSAVFLTKLMVYSWVKICKPKKIII